jgi:superfamily II DNA or RNA helicase
MGMGDLLPLRDYQQACIDAVRSDWSEGVRRTAAVLPTGSGKTVVFAHKAKQWRDVNDSRVMILVHRDELIIQTVNKLRAIAPHLSVGIVKGSKREINRDVIVVSVQSLRTEAARNKITHLGLIVVDECHHATAKTYRDILTHYGALPVVGGGTRHGVTEPAIAVGFTATLARGDGVSLGDIWQKVSYRKDILWMIRRGYLLDVYARRVEVDDLSFANVRSRGGDYQEGDLGTALMESLAPETTAASYLEHATYVDEDGEVKLRSGVGFAPTVESAFAFAEAFNALDIKSEVVTGETPAEERRAIFGRCHDGTTTVLWNCGVATEGTDVPVWSCAVIARPTKSGPLYQQMVGRVLRPYPGQGPGQPVEKALVLDVVGVTRAHQLRSLVDLTGKTFREEVKEDESLLDHDEFELALEEETEQRGGGDLAWEYLDGPTRTVEVDLFAASRQQWLQTDAGIWFVSAGKQHFVFLVPSTDEPGMFDVAWCTKYRAGKGRSGDVTEHRNVSLEIAMAWGEDVVSEYPDADLIADKNRSWRKARPTQKTINYARGLGLDFPADIKAHDLSNMIAHCEATRRIDAIAKLMGRI